MTARPDYVAMPHGYYVRRVRASSEEPSSTLVRWRLAQVRHADGSVQRHLRGNMNGEGRISTRVSAIDLETMHVTTATGRIYCLDGPPGDDLDAAYLYVLWLESCGRSELKDLSRSMLRLRRIRLNLLWTPVGAD